MRGVAQEMGHHVVSGMAVGENRVVSPAYEVTVVPKLCAATGVELGEGCLKVRGRICSAGSTERGGAHSPL